MPEIDLHLMSLLNHRCLCQSHLVVLLYPLVSLLLKILLSLYLIPEILHLTSLLKSLLSLPLWNLFAESPWYLTSLLLLLFLLPHHDQHRYIHIRNLHSQRTQNLSQRNAGLDVTDWWNESDWGDSPSDSCLGSFCLTVAVRNSFFLLDLVFFSSNFLIQNVVGSVDEIGY